MRIKKTNILTSEQNDEVLALQQVCLNEEDLENEAFLTNEINFDKSIPCFYMIYEDDKLVSFLTTFMPLCDEAEIIAFTHPEYRNRGYFKKLLKCAAESLKNAKVGKILFVVETKSKSGLKMLESLKCNSIEHSEYRMSCVSNDMENNNKLRFVKVDKDNKDIFINITSDGFIASDEQERFADAIINNEDKEAYIAFKDNDPVGCFNFNYKDNIAFLYGVAILRSHRNEGFGTEMVTYALKIGLSKCSKVLLDVDSENDIAFKLYKKVGFNIESQVDYYKYEL